MTTADPNRMIRRTGITAREAVALSGLTDWTSLTEIYNAKVADIPLREEPPGDHEMLKAFYRRQTGMRLEQHGLLRNTERRFALADPGFAAIGAQTTVHLRSGLLAPDGVHAADRLVRFTSSTKTAAWGPPGGQIVPDAIYNECQWDMGVAGKELTDVAVRFLGGGFAVYTIKFVEKIFDGYYSIAEHFMATFALPGVPPPTVEEMMAAYRAQLDATAEEAKAPVVPSKGA